ncbi:MAG: acyltransferase [Bacteroidales bacterium]|nr:acyltransferase [Bacteroidales bacterium]
MGREWSGKTHGGTFMQRRLIGLLRWTDVRVIYFFMAFAIPFYMIFNRKGYRAMRDFFVRRGARGLRIVWYIFRNHFVFGQVIIDRFAVYAGRGFDFEHDGKEQVDACFSEPGGFLMLSSHTGNYELAGCTLKSDNKRVHALVYAGETEAIMENRGRVLGGHSTDMIPVKNDMSHIFMMNAAIDDGDAVSMPADRLLGSKKNLPCIFMGSEAALPAGPFVFAAQKEIPVFAVFVMKKKATRYTLIVRRVDNEESRSESSVRGRAAIMAKSYAGILENVVKQYPYQWFNYFDFWNQ